MILQWFLPRDDWLHYYFSTCITLDWSHIFFSNVLVSFTSWNFGLLLLLFQYQPDEQVTLWVNKVGPYNNPQETYNYYSLPFCRKSDHSVHKWGGLGEVLGGNELIDSQIDIKFLSMSINMQLSLSWFCILSAQKLYCRLLFSSRKCWQKRDLSIGAWWS